MTNPEEPFDFGLLGEAFGHIKDHGMTLQKKGIELVRIANSGMSNIAHMQTLAHACLELSKQSPSARPALDFLYESGKHSLALANNATIALQLSVPVLESAITGVTFAASGSNVAAGTVVAQLVGGFPDQTETILAAWPPKGLARSFEDIELDTYLEKFDPQLRRRRAGAWQVFHSCSDDSVAQASHTMRDILRIVIAKEASNEKIEICPWYKKRKAIDPDAKPVMRDRIRFLLYDASDEALDEVELERMERAIRLYVDDDGALKQVAHGSKSFSQQEAKLSMQNIEELLFLTLRRLYKAGKA